ncbi:MAG TPA: PRC-barrel domain-containing protein [Pyrinomonadaceae bacterium]|nr:PRC-barrel domain-containing protein [Pyrinomonadaceae bacterium]
MLRQIRELGTYRLHATDGDIGHLEQFYFDDRDWKIRYFVVDIGTWLHGKKVLMSPSAIIGVDAPTKTINAAFSKQQVQESDDVDRHKPEGLEEPHDYSLYLGWPYYLGLNALNDFDHGPLPDKEHDPQKGKTSEYSYRQACDEHLRSSKIVSRYHVMAVDGEIGQIEDGIVDDQTWTIQYVVSTVRNWWSGKKVLLPTEWILWVSAAEGNVYVSLTRNSIATAPSFDPEKPLTHDLEIALYNHYCEYRLRSNSSRRSNASLPLLDSERPTSFISLLETLDGRNYRYHKK